MKTSFKNRKGKEVVVLVEEAENPKGLAFIMHGLGGFKEQWHIERFAAAFKNKGYTAIRFDTTSSLGESDGEFQDVTIKSSFEDLEDLLSWSSSQTWHQEPFCLAGHSLGGICTLLYAEKYPEKVKAIAPISTVISGKLNHEVRPKEELETWKESGWQVTESVSKPGVMKRLPWSFMEDMLNYDILKATDKLFMPVLLIVGENDTGTPLKHHKMLYDKLPGKKEIHVIKNAGHNFRETEQLDEIQSIFEKWIDTL